MEWLELLLLELYFEEDKKSLRKFSSYQFMLLTVIFRSRLLWIWSPDPPSLSVLQATIRIWMHLTLTSPLSWATKKYLSLWINSTNATRKGDKECGLSYMFLLKRRYWLTRNKQLTSGILTDMTRMISSAWNTPLTSSGRLVVLFEKISEAKLLSTVTGNPYLLFRTFWTRPPTLLVIIRL